MGRKNKHFDSNGNQQVLEDLRSQVAQLQNELAAKNKQIEELSYYESELKKERPDPQELRSAIEAEVRADEERIRQEYREHEIRQINALKEVAEAEAASIRKDAQDGSAQILSDARGEADQCCRAAEAHAEETREQADRVLAEAELHKAELLAEAMREKESTLQEALQHFEAECAERKASLEAREQSIEQAEAEVKTRQLQLKVQKEDFEWERDELALKSKALKGRWEQCSPERLAIATAKLEEAERLLEVQEQSIASLVAERDKLRALVPVADGRPAESILRDLACANSRVRSLKDQLAAYPALEELESLRKDSAQLSSLRVEYHSLARKCSDLEQRSLHLELAGREMEQLKVEADALRVLNDELRSELQTHKDALEQKTGERFPELCRIDRKHSPSRSEYPAFPGGAGLLQRLAKHVRQYAASRKPQLFYSEQTVRAFIAGLAASRLSILQGLSGTGKTSLPRVFIEAIGGEYATIPVQSSWRDRHELLGYNNDFNKRFSESEFTKAVYRSGFDDQQEKVWFILLDEMNLARIEYYFADFLSVLEEPDPEKWAVHLMDYNPFTQPDGSPRNLLDGRKLKVGQNLWFIGTANQDESTFEITDKVYDRAQVLDFRVRQTEFNSLEIVEPKYLSRQALQRTFDSATQQASYRLSSEEWNYIESIDECLRERLDLSFGNRIKLQMERFVPVFVACGGRKDEAVDLQIARKVLRKLVNRFDAGLPDALKELQSTIESKPAGWDELGNTVEIIDRKILKARGAAV